MMDLRVRPVIGRRTRRSILEIHLHSRKPMTDHSPSRAFNLADDEVAVYRSLSAMAVVGLLAGLLSPLAYLLRFDFFAAAGGAAAAVLSALALRKIAVQSPYLVGRKAALAGLLLGVTFLVAVPTNSGVYHYFIRREARQFADQWIKDVRNGDVLAADQLTLDARKRAGPDADLPELYVKRDDLKKMLDLFRDQAVIRTLFALGRTAEYRYYETAEEGGMEDGDYVKMAYAVTYADPQKGKTTFFITMGMSRRVDPQSGRCDWTMGRTEGPVRPSGW